MFNGRAAGRGYLASVARGGWMAVAVAAVAGCQPAPSGSARFGGKGAAPDRPDRDAALMPPPDVFLASADNAAAEGELPASPAADVVRAAGGGPGDPAANRFTVTVPVDGVAAVQQTPTLCWAACTQTLLRQEKVEVNQRQLANHFEPDPDNQTAGVGVIVRALNPDLGPQLDLWGAVPIDLVGLTSDQLLTELMAGRLCVVGLVENPADGMGHACVVCGATFARLNPSPLAVLAGSPEAPVDAPPPAAAPPGSAAGTAKAYDPKAYDPAADPAHDADALRSKLSPAYGLYEVELFDPEPGAGHRTMSGDEFRRQAAFFTSHMLARRTLLHALKGMSSSDPSAGTSAGTSAGSSSGSTSTDATSDHPAVKTMVYGTSMEDARLASLPVRRVIAARREQAQARAGDPTPGSSKAAKRATPQPTQKTPAQQRAAAQQKAKKKPVPQAAQPQPAQQSQPAPQP